MYNTIEESLKTNHVATIISEKTFNVNGNDRVMIRARKANGKKEYMIVQYENGCFSSPVTY